MFCCISAVGVAHSQAWVALPTAQLGLKEGTDTERMYRYCRDLAGEEHDFFIRKAIGWALRHHSRTDPEGVRAFVEATPNLSKLSRSEALKYC